MRLKILNQLEKLKKIPLKEIYRAQRRKIVISVLILSLSLIYFSSIKARQRTKEEAIYWKRQYLLTKALFLEIKSEGEMVELLQKRYRELNRTISRPAENILQLVTIYAQRMNIRIVDIKAYPVQALKQENKNMAAGIKTLLLRIKADAGYINLARYLEALQRVTPALVTVEKLKIKKVDRNALDKLRIVLELRFWSPSLKASPGAFLTAYRLKYNPQHNKGASFLWEKNAEDREIKRNPFLYGSQSNDRLIAASGFSLKGIIWDSKKPSAVINEQVLGVGDVIGDFKIIQIKQESVILENAGSKLELTMNE